MSASDYPIPACAAYIWTAGDKLFLGLPGEAGQGHTVVIPLDKMVPEVGMTGLPKSHHRGFAVLLETLRQREFAPVRPMIGQKGALPKDAIMKACESDDKYKAWGVALQMDRKRNEASKAEAESFLQELGL